MLVSDVWRTSTLNPKLVDLVLVSGLWWTLMFGVLVFDVWWPELVVVVVVVVVSRLMNGTAIGKQQH